MSKQPLFESMITHSKEWASKRKYAYQKNKKKISGESLAVEIRIAKVLGYLDSAEHLLKAIVANKDWDREEIEAQLHYYIEDLSRIAQESLGAEKTIDLEYILKEYGYYDEAKK